MYTQQQFSREKVRVICPWSEHHGKIGFITGASNYVHIQFDDEPKPLRFAPNMISKIDQPLHK